MKWNFYLESATEKVDLFGLTLEEARELYMDAVNRYYDMPYFHEFGDDECDFNQEHFEGTDREEHYFKGGFCPEF